MRRGETILLQEQEGILSEEVSAEETNQVKNVDPAADEAVCFVY